MKKILTLLIVFSSLSCLNQEPTNKIPENFDYGKSEGNVYKNSFFDMVVPYNETWNVQSKQEFKELTDQGADLVYGSSPDIKEAYKKAADVTAANLFAVFKYQEDTDADIDFNPSFLMMAENLKGVGNVKTAKDYLILSKDMLKRADVNYIIDDNITTKTIDGVEFSILKVKLDYVLDNIEQEMYATIKNGFCLFMTISYTNETDKKELNAMINNVRFNVSKKGKPKK